MDGHGPVGARRAVGRGAHQAHARPCVCSVTQDRGWVVLIKSCDNTAQFQSLELAYEILRLGSAETSS